ncbi:hypothetical protein VRU48_17380 [Pedobacter sp. KR3-3]|uniref:Bacteriocin n=1 Tax=Pedobacter albus TaxID=3113905 RepID=A0ABU7IBQ7_9SPHI|nr:hypothetical protein [Pedobacter sp. KR3-3]MEE1946902.1 hypothetical protein [Pedobacter sp. KR3-3]
MKKSNLLSKSEMKKVTGGVPAWSATCTDPISGSWVCYDRISTCIQYCWDGWSCSVNTGVVGCG